MFLDCLLLGLRIALEVCFILVIPTAFLFGLLFSFSLRGSFLCFEQFSFGPLFFLFLGEFLFLFLLFFLLSLEQGIIDFALPRHGSRCRPKDIVTLGLDFDVEVWVFAWRVFRVNPPEARLGESLLPNSRVKSYSLTVLFRSEPFVDSAPFQLLAFLPHFELSFAPLLDRQRKEVKSVS